MHQWLRQRTEPARITPSRHHQEKPSRTCPCRQDLRQSSVLLLFHTQDDDSCLPKTPVRRRRTALPDCETFSCPVRTPLPARHALKATKVLLSIPNCPRFPRIRTMFAVRRNNNGFWQTGSPRIGLLQLQQLELIRSPDLLASCWSFDFSRGSTYCRAVYRSFLLPTGTPSREHVRQTRGNSDKPRFQFLYLFRNRNPPTIPRLEDPCCAPMFGGSSVRRTLPDGPLPTISGRVPDISGGHG